MSGYSDGNPYSELWEVYIALNPKIVPRLTEEELALSRRLSGMSNNFNQFVRLCHQYGLESMLRDAQYYLGQFRKLFAKFNTD